MGAYLDGVTTTTDYTYDTGAEAVLSKRSESVTNSNGTVTTSTYFYANDAINLPNSALNTELKNRNMIGFPIKVRQQTGNAVKWTKVDYRVLGTNQIEPEYLYKSFEATPTNWIKRLHIADYTTHGMPKIVYKNNFDVPETYEWSNKLLTKKQFGYLSSTTNLLEWNILYQTGTSLVDKITDENRLVKKYTYDPLMRLTTSKDRVNPTDESDFQGLTTLTYHYNGQPVSDPYDNASAVNTNFIRTKNTFKGVTAPLSTKQISLSRKLACVRVFGVDSYMENSLLAAVNELSKCTYEQVEIVKNPDNANKINVEVGIKVAFFYNQSKVTGWVNALPLKPNTSPLVGIILGFSGSNSFRLFTGLNYFKRALITTDSVRGSYFTSFTGRVYYTDPPQEVSTNFLEIPLALHYEFVKNNPAYIPKIMVGASVLTHLKSKYEDYNRIKRQFVDSSATLYASSRINPSFFIGAGIKKVLLDKSVIELNLKYAFETDDPTDEGRIYSKRYEVSLNYLFPAISTKKQKY